MAATEDPQDDTDDTPVPDNVDDSLRVTGDPDDPDNRVEYVRSGLIRVYVDGQRFRLRRPFFGEFKRFRLALQDYNDEISDLSNESMALARRMTHDAERRPEGESPDEYDAWLSANRKASRDAGRKLTDLAEELRHSWWVEVFKTLSIDGLPDDMPAWVVDPGAATDAIAHWRSVPSGRG